MPNTFCLVMDSPIKKPQQKNDDWIKLHDQGAVDGCCIDLAIEGEGAHANHPKQTQEGQNQIISSFNAEHFLLKGKACTQKQASSQQKRIVERVTGSTSLLAIRCRTQTKVVAQRKALLKTKTHPTDHVSSSFLYLLQK